MTWGKMRRRKRKVALLTGSLNFKIQKVRRGAIGSRTVRRRENGGSNVTVPNPSRAGSVKEVSAQLTHTHMQNTNSS